MRWVEPATFTMGADSAYADEAPHHTVRLTRGFWIHERLVTNSHYAQYLNELAGLGHAERAMRDPVVTCQSGEVVWNGARFVPREDRDNHPVVGADWNAARAYAAHYALQLPTEAQWELAARGADGRTYPWGNRWYKARCCCEENPGSSYHPPGNPDEDTRTIPVGSLPKGASPCNALDMAGNLMEWCEDWYDENWYASPLRTAVDPAGPLSSPQDKRVVRGGNYYYDRTRCNTTCRLHSSRPGTSTNSIGFRCVYQDPNWPAITSDPV